MDYAMSNRAVGTVGETTIIDPAYHQQHGELCMMTSQELGEMLAQLGYRLTKLKRKQDKVYALLYLEEWPVVQGVVDKLGLERVTVIGGQ
jgi:hypothetical protein